MPSRLRPSSKRQTSTPAVWRSPFLRFAIALLIASTPAWSQEANEASVKAAIVLNFARFTKWPESAFGGSSAPLTIGIVGDNAVAAALDTLAAGARNGGHPIVVERGVSKACQMLFVGKGSASQTSSLLGRANAACLAVGDSADFIQQGGAIRYFVGSDRKPGFQINFSALKQRGIEPSADMRRRASGS